MYKLFHHVKVGDIVHRMIGLNLHMDLEVTSIDDDYIYCGDKGGWKFSRSTGLEIDKRLGWDEYNSGSRLIK